jgi:methyl-accepting chemotaxis protein
VSGEWYNFLLSLAPALGLSLVFAAFLYFKYKKSIVFQIVLYTYFPCIILIIANFTPLEFKLNNIALMILLNLTIIVAINLAMLRLNKKYIKPLGAAILGIKDASIQLSSTSEQVSTTSQSLAEGAAEQASSIEQVSASLEEISSMTVQNNENARNADALAKEASGNAKTMQESMKRMLDTITTIKDSADETAKIVKTIDEFAFQTNMLALNAAVEAAKAGDAGKGFGVVAEEVRNLAQRSAQAAKNSASLIETSQKNAEKGVNVTHEVDKRIKAIIERIEKVTGIVSELAEASREQTLGIQQINVSISQVDQITQSNASNAEESASVGIELAGHAKELQRMVSQLDGLANLSRTVKDERSPFLAPPTPKGGVKKDEPSDDSKPGDKGHASEKTGTKPEDIIPLNNDDLNEF